MTFGMPTQREPRTIDLDAVAEHLRQFASERDWKQFHTPKNLAMALAAESGELLELFQWLTPEESQAIAGSGQAHQLGEELADILQYVIRIADVAGIDLETALWEKLRKNELRYPVDQVKGRAVKLPPDGSDR